MSGGISRVMPKLPTSWACRSIPTKRRRTALIAFAGSVSVLRRTKARKEQKTWPRTAASGKRQIGRVCIRVLAVQNVTGAKTPGSGSAGTRD